MHNRPRDRSRINEQIIIFQKNHHIFGKIFEQVNSGLRYCAYEIEDNEDIFNRDNVDDLQIYLDSEDKISQIINLARVSCEYGAVKCFKFLILNYEIEIDIQLLNDAIIGGNLEIIRIKLQSGVEITSLVSCILSHQYEVFDWAIQNNENLIDSEIINLMIEHEFIYGLEKLPNQEIPNNIECPFIEYHLFRLENNVKNASIAVFDACTYGMVDFLRFIIKRFNITDVNTIVSRESCVTEYSEITPLIRACEMKNLEIIKILLSVDGIDINKEGFRINYNDTLNLDGFKVTPLSELIRNDFNDGIDLFVQAGKLNKNTKET